MVKGGAGNWSALNMFSYKYFKLLYNKLDALKENDDLGCQFFPYKTNFASLEDVFKMSKKRAALKKDQWYIGWLVQFSPYFLDCQIRSAIELSN